MVTESGAAARESLCRCRARSDACGRSFAAAAAPHSSASDAAMSRIVEREWRRALRAHV